MARKHHSAHSDSVGAASVVKRRVPRAKLPASAGSEKPAASSPDARPSARRESTIDNEAIARLAYSYWVARGCIGGSPEQDWLRAEHELRSQSLEPAIA